MLKLAENIRALRKQRNLTQEQLAEVLGVTVGAVYKWEARLSLPEMNLLIEMADFFDVSVDALLGYEMKDNGLEATVARLEACHRGRDRQGLAEAEKALKKYPHDFRVVYESASLYLSFGASGREEPLLQRALRLLEDARLLIQQNRDPKINQDILFGKMAEARLAMGQVREAVSLLEAHNAGGMYDDVIGLNLAADCNDYDASLPYLSDALISHVAALIRVILGYANAYDGKGDPAKAREVLQWGIGALMGLKDGEKPCFLDKICSALYVALAGELLSEKNPAAARQALITAQTLAAGFDRAPDYRPSALKFVTDHRPAGVYDDLGTTALEGVRRTIADMNQPELTAWWKEIQEHEA